MKWWDVAGRGEWEQLVVHVALACCGFEGGFASKGGVCLEGA